jgi:hypothetical protein
MKTKINIENSKFKPTVFRQNNSKTPKQGSAEKESSQEKYIF